MTGPTVRRLLVGTSICAGILAFELGLQIRRGNLFPPPVTEADTLFRRSSDPVLIYDMRPNAEAHVNGVRYATNRAGFRDDEFPESPPADTEKLLVIGDSVAMGLGVPMRQAFPQVLESSLGRGRGGGRVLVYNLAVAGYSTEQEIRLLETRGLKLRPDRVLWIYVLNDPDTMDGGLAFYFAAPRIELVRIASAVVSKSTHLVNNYRRASLIEHDYYEFIHDLYAGRTEEQFARLAEIQSESGVAIEVVLSPVFGFGPGERYPWAHLDARIQNLAWRNGLGFFNLLDAMGEYPWQQVLQDELHPTERGHKVMAEAIRGYLQSR